MKSRDPAGLAVRAILALAGLMLGACGSSVPSAGAGRSTSTGGVGTSGATSANGAGASGATSANGAGASGATSSGGSAGSGTADSLALPAVLPVPTLDQAAWQRRELTVFFHFGINTFSDREWGDGSESPMLFNPSALDASQWLSVIKSAGFKQAILVAKHHDGFCLWPSKYTDHSVKSSPWRGGQGDVVAEFTAAARAAGVKIGLYLSPWDRHEASFGSAAYNVYFENQLRELLSNYGPIDEIWFDGAGSDAQVYDWPAFYAVIRQLQPHALIAISGPDVRWVGNEAGIAPLGETSVQTVDGNVVWYPSESDVSIRPGWFYHASEDSALKPLAQLLDVYFKSVGRNSTLLLNLPPDQRGLLADADIARLGEFSGALDTTFQTNLAAGQAASADRTYQNAPAAAAAMAVDGRLDTFWAAAQGSTSGRLEVDLGALRDFNLVSVREPIELGERARKYHIEVEQSGTWQTIATGTVIGQRNLLGVAPVTAQKIALVIEAARGVPAVAEFGVYSTPFWGSGASGSLLAHKPVQVSNVHPAGTVYGGDKALDDDPATRWATADGTTAAWLEVDMQSAQTIGRLEIDEFSPRISKFQLQFRLNEADPWQVAYDGNGAGTAFKATFPAVSARYVRLNISAASNSPTIWEFRIFPP